jgi:eukaryotic-like serine/threonine-protein kinase
MKPADDNIRRNEPGDFSRDAGEDPRLVEVLEEYQRELDQGRFPDRQQYVNRYPELADTVNECLEGLEMLHGGIQRGAKNSLRIESSRRRQPTIGRMANPLGDFQIVREIARGGMGIVYEAIQLSLGRRVALKVLPFAATLDSRQLQRFKNEAQAAALLHHTHIVPIYAVGCERGVHFYAMQLIEGQSLAAVIKQLRASEGRNGVSRLPGEHLTSTDLSNTEAWRGESQPIDFEHSDVAPALEKSTVDMSTVVTGGSSMTSEAYVRRVAQLIIQAAEALEHAHQIGVVHRDIKPANLLVDANGNLWVTDFGLAQLQSEHNLTRSGDFLGTLRYMSPEQMSGQRAGLDHRTDIYSLGATFYELLTLEPVFTGETHHELLYQILHQEPRSPRQLNRGIAPELETIVQKALGKSSVERYRTAGEFAADIQRYLKHEPVLAKRPSLVDRMRKWARRHPAVVIAGALLLLVVAIASLVSNRLINDALNREKLRANEAEMQFRQARKAVDALFRVSEEDLADKPEGAARRHILEIVLGFYRDFVEQHREDPNSKADLELFQGQVQNILDELDVLRQDMDTRLLGNPLVQQDLKLTPDQTTHANALMEQWSHEHEKMRGLSEEERRKRMVENATVHEQALAQLLTQPQQSRFAQLGIQRQGLMAFKEPEVVKALQLTSEQRAKIREIEHEAFDRRMPPPGMGGPPGEPPGRGPPGGGPRGPPPREEHLDFNRQDLIDRALAVLTSDQLDQWRALIGPRFYGFRDELFSGPPDGPPGGPPDGPPRF